MSVEIETMHQWMSLVLNVRIFKPDPVPAALEEALVESFRLGPSSANVQPWELIKVESEAFRKRVVGATLDPFLSAGTEGAQAWLTQVPLLLAVCLDRPRATARLGAIGWEHSQQDTFAALQNMRLQAIALGLGTTVIREFQPAAMQKALSLPYTVEPLCLLAVGFAGNPPEVPPRLPLELIYHREEAQGE